MTIPLAPYGSTRGRIHVHPGRDVRPLTTTIDSHCHLHIDKAEKTVEGHVDLNDIPLFRWVSDHTRQVNMAQAQDIAVPFTSLDARLEAMDRMGVDFQVVAPSPNQAFYWVEGERGITAAREVNEGIAAAVRAHPDKFAGLATLPMQDVEAAIAELEHAVLEMGMKGAQILTWIHGKEISDPSFEPFWAKVQELDVPIFIHPNGFAQGERFVGHYFSNLIANPLDTAMAIQRLIFDGVMDRYPRLKIMGAHGGGYIPAYHARMDHAWGARKDCRENISAPPSFYLRKMWFDTVVFSYEQLEYLAGLYGPNKIIMGTDYPFDMMDDDPVGHVMNAPNLSDQAKAMITGANAIELFKLDIKP